MITMLAFAKLMVFLQICQQNLYPLPCCISFVYLKATKPQVQITAIFGAGKRGAGKK